jgi:hypothetical protein
VLGLFEPDRAGQHQDAGDKTLVVTTGSDSRAYRICCGGTPPTIWGLLGFPSLAPRATTGVGRRTVRTDERGRLAGCLWTASPARTRQVTSCVPYDGGVTCRAALILATRAVDVRIPVGDHGRERFAKFLARRSDARAVPGKDPQSQIDNSPTLFATDRTDRVTYIAQGWKVTDPEALADIGPVPNHETLIEIPDDVLKFYARRYLEQEGER